jgi:hypothetical protein
VSLLLSNDGVKCLLSSIRFKDNRLQPRPSKRKKKGKGQILDQAAAWQRLCGRRKVGLVVMGIYGQVWWFIVNLSCHKDLCLLGWT